jgi:DNA-binding response OmpR family regulator
MGLASMLFQRRSLASKSMAYDAIVLDLGLPDRDGIEVLGELRHNNSAAIVLILTARDGINDRVSGLDAGADDYLVKPFAMTELAARLKALLRRPRQPLAAILKSGNLHLDTASRQVTANNSFVRFSAREIEARELLIQREGQVITRTSFENSIYGRLAPEWRRHHHRHRRWPDRMPYIGFILLCALPVLFFGIAHS